MLAEDLRCLDAHAHLGNFAFERHPKQAMRHYTVGAAIGDLSEPLAQGTVVAPKASSLLRQQPAPPH